MIKFIDYYKERLDYFDFDFDLRPSEEYEDFSRFTDHLNSQAYEITFHQKISEAYINYCVEKGYFYLFKIYNKDFSPYSKGKKNLHTLYWEALFDNKNYKLNGEAELFHRYRSIFNKTIHPKHHPIFNKNPNNSKRESIFKIDLIKDKRYTEDKFLFHCPITLNFQAPGNDINSMVIDKLIRNNEDIHVLSIDRGERHLAYYTLLDPYGNIIIQKSFNIIGDMKFDYRKKLDVVEENRTKSRKNWKKIANIKNLKEGYLSLVVHEIAKLVVKYNAVVVFEDLNADFKRSRTKIEKQVYQKLEKMLIDKLNYLVFKDKPANEPGGILNAYQLTPKVEGYSKIGRQTGIIFYVPPYFTSKICPATGFVDQLYPRYESVQLAQDFFRKFDSIKYNPDKKYFEFKFDYKNFGEKAIKGRWTVCTVGSRLRNYRNPDKNSNWDTEEIHLNTKFESLFKNKEHDIEFYKGEELKEQIVAQTQKTFFEPLLRYLKLTLQMRNSRTGTEEDYFISPVADKNGIFFDSRSASDNMPQDADANGAYHIGLKGLWLVRQIQNQEKGQSNFAITNKEWFKFAQKICSQK